jgi:hypothetical protein
MSPLKGRPTKMPASRTTSGLGQRARRRRYERQRQKSRPVKFERAAKLAGKSACATGTVAAGARRGWCYIAETYRQRHWPEASGTNCERNDCVVGAEDRDRAGGYLGHRQECLCYLKERRRGRGGRYVYDSGGAELSCGVSLSDYDVRSSRCTWLAPGCVLEVVSHFAPLWSNSAVALHGRFQLKVRGALICRVL